MLSRALFQSLELKHVERKGPPTTVCFDRTRSRSEHGLPAILSPDASPFLPFFLSPS